MHAERSVRVSVVISTRNNIGHLSNCLNTLYPTLALDDEVILVPNGGSDAERNVTEDQCVVMSDFAGVATHVKVWKGEPGFPATVSWGMQHAKGKYIILLNDDCVLTLNWLKFMFEARDAAMQQCPDINWSFVGAVSNRTIPIQEVNVRQVPHANDPTRREEVAEGLAQQKGLPKFIPAGTLSGFCLMITREAYQAVGEWDAETYGIGGFCDNDYILRGTRMGHRALVATRAFVYHEGHTTLDRAYPEHNRGMRNRANFMRKWHTNTKQTVCASYRVKIDTELALGYFLESVKRAKEILDWGVLLDDRSEIDLMKQLKEADLWGFFREYRKKKKEQGLTETEDRDNLLNMARGTKSDWIWNLDHDEVIDETLTPARLNRLLNPYYPHTESYSFPCRTLWRGREHFRADEIWGRLRSHTLHRNIPGQGSIYHEPDQPFHCRRVPTMTPMDVVRPTNAITIRHYGYENYKECIRKREWYETIDENPDPKLVGAAHYKHLTEEFPVLLLPYKHRTVTLALLVKDEEDDLARVIMELGDWVDEIIVCETAGNPQIQQLCKDLDVPYLSYRCCDHATEPEHYLCDFAKARNYVVDQAQTDYILFLDPDESINLGDLVHLTNCMNEERDGYVFEIRNYQPGNKIYQTLQTRLFLKQPLLRYTSKIHESLEEAIQKHKAHLRIAHSNVILHHYGFLRKPRGSEERKQKNAAYEAHLRKLLEKEPNDVKAIFALGQHLNTDHHQYDEGDPLIARAVQLEPMFFNARFELTMRFMRRAYDLLISTPKDSVPTNEKKMMLEKCVQMLHSWVGEQL